MVTNNYYFKKIPKIELHAHLTGSLTVDSIRKLITMSNEENIPVPQLMKAPTSIEEIFKLFPVIQRVTSTYETVKQATIDVITNFSDENTIYLELRTTPKDRPSFTKQEYVQAVLDGIQECSSLPIVVRVLLSIDRRQTIQEAEETVQMVCTDKSGLIVGIDLSGDPSIDGRKFLPVLRKARSSGIKLAIHLAEIESCLEEVDAFLDLKPDRIGHGVFLHKEDRWVQAIAANRIPFEICLTSNVMSMSTASIAESHFSFWQQIGVPLATDDSGLMGTNLTNEYRLAAENFLCPMKKVLQDSLDISFLKPGSEEFKKLKTIIETME